MPRINIPQGFPHGELFRLLVDDACELAWVPMRENRMVRNPVRDHMPSEPVESSGQRVLVQNLWAAGRHASHFPVWERRCHATTAQSLRTL